MKINALRHCVGQLSRFPGIGERTATRLTYWLLQQPPDVAESIGEALQALRQDVVRCSSCCNICSQDPCRLCSDPGRDAGTICVVEHPQDVPAIEAAGEYRGTYHVLDGAISHLDGVTPDQLRVNELLSRIELGTVQEVVVATDADVEGNYTALYLASLLKPLGIRVTRLARGLAAGTEIEYADRSSVALALEHRREL